jgi:hypothetical protein
MIKYLNIILFTGMLVMNYLANALPLNNKSIVRNIPWMDLYSHYCQCHCFACTL